MSRVLARSMFKKKAPKRSARGVGITSMLEDDVPGYAEGGEVKDDRTERERMAEMLLEQGREEFKGFAEGERPQMFRPPATMGMMQQPNPQQMQAAQMQQMAQMGLLPRFQEGGFVQRQPISGWGSRIPGWASLVPGWSQSSSMAAPSAMSSPEPQDTTVSPATSVTPPPALADVPVTTPQQDSLAARLATRRSAEQQRMAAEEEAIRTRNAAQDDVIKSPEGQAAMNLMTEGRLLNDPALYQKGRDALKALTDEAYKTRGATTGPLFPGGTELPAEPVYTPSAAQQDTLEADRESRRARGLSSLPYTPKKEAPPLPPPGDKKTSSLPDIKAEREARKAELAAEAAAARKENAWLALMQAGLAIAGGRRPNAITNIGQGGQAGLASFMALEQQRRRDEDAAMRRAVAEREVQLQERRLNMQEPYIQAQTEYLRQRPAIAAAQLQARQQGLLAKAQMDATNEVNQQADKNPLLYPAGPEGELKKQVAIRNRTQQLAEVYSRIYGGTPSGGTGGLDLELPDQYRLGD